MAVLALFKGGRSILARLIGGMIGSVIGLVVGLTFRLAALFIQGITTTLILLYRWIRYKMTGPLPVARALRVEVKDLKNYRNPPSVTFR